MLEEIMAEASILVSSLDYTRQVSKDELGVVDEFDYADVWSKSCEWIVGDLGKCTRKSTQKRRLTSIRIAYKANISNNF